MTDLRVCFVGDSYVAGVGDRDHRGWLGRVAARAHQAGRPLTSYVLGVRGQTSRDVADRWLGECTPRLPPGCDGRVLFAVGVNDTTASDTTASDTTVEDGGTRVPVADSAAHLHALLAGARLRGWPALVVGPPPVAEPAQNDRTARLDAAFASACHASGTGYVHVLDRLLADPVWMREVAEGDGAHPGGDGYRRLADLVWEPWWSWITTEASTVTARAQERRPPSRRPPRT